MVPSVLSAPHRSSAGAWVLILGAAALGLAPSSDGDIWWHLATGREMVARGALLHTDPFSVSALGRPWHDVHWLFQLAVYGIHRAVGLGGLVLAKCALLGWGAWLLYSALEQHRNPWTRGLFVTALLAGLLAARSLLLVRPVLGTLVLLAFFFLQLERFRRDDQWKPLLWLVPTQVLWANIQGLSALGPALLGAYAVAAVADARFGEAPAWPFAREAAKTSSPWRRAQVLGGVLLACAVATCLTPFGWGAATLPAVLLGRLLPGEGQVFARQVAENLPPLTLERLSGGEFWHFKWALALLALSTFAAGRRLKLSHALVLLGFAALALMSNRNVLLLYWVGAPLFALYLAPPLRALIGSKLGRSGLRVAIAANALALGGVGLVSAAAAAQETPLSRPSPFRVPAGSAERLAKLPGGDIFAADHFGGYLIWRLYPEFRPYIDTRLVLRTEHEYANYLRLADEPERFDDFQARHHFRYVVLPVTFPERYQALIAHLGASRDWQLLFTDGSEVLFGRRESTDAPPFLADETAAAGVRDDLALRYGAWPKAHTAALTSLATLHGLLGQHALADRALAGLHAPEAGALAARLRFVAGDLAGAERLAGARLGEDREDVPSLNLLAQIALRRGEDARGLDYLRRALRARPSDEEAQRLLVTLEENRP